MSLPHSHRSLSNWPLVALTGMIGAALLVACVVIWYAFMIALPTSQRVETNGRTEERHLDVLTKHMLRVEESLHLRQ